MPVPARSAAMMRESESVAARDGPYGVKRRKRMFVAGSAGFAVASLAAALAVSPAMLIGCRLAQGGAAALLIPQGLGIIRDVFPRAELGRAFAVFGPVIGLSAVLGPIIGGALVSLDAFGTGWRRPGAAAAASAARAP